MLEQTTNVVCFLMKGACRNSRGDFALQESYAGLLLAL